MDGKNWFYCRCYEEVNEEIQDILDKRNQLQKQNKWLIDTLADCESKRLRVSKRILLHSINAELEKLDK